MSEQEINIAIADASGLPWLDYCNDLNAMHEAENWMIANKSLMNFWKYADTLKRHFSNLGDDGCIHATARQRAEAFLRTLGKWEGGK